MNRRTGILFAASVAAAIGAASAADSPLDTSADCVFGLDSMGSPHALKTQTDLAAVSASVRAGDTITSTAPDGTKTILVNDAAADGTLPLQAAIDAGGLWTFANTPQGTATFTVRHSLYGTLGDGTAASPAKLVDGDELLDYAAGDGYVFTLEGGDTVLGSLRLPSGFRLEDAGNGAWRIVSSPDGCLYTWAQLTWPVDTRQAGPDRTTLKKGVPAVAYSGDGWAGDASAASTLTLRSPSGAETTHSLTGTGAQSFPLREAGVWNITLVSAKGTMSSAVTVMDDAFMLIVR